MDCSIITVDGDELEKSVLDHLYGIFLDQPAFDEAVKRALPSAKDREDLDKKIEANNKRLVENKRKIDRLVDGIADGVDVGWTLAKQETLKAEQETLSRRVNELLAQAASMPDVDEVQRAAKLTRLLMVIEHMGKDWRDLTYDEVRRFLLHLFGETTKANGNGIFVAKDDKGRVTVTLKGRVAFDYLPADGRLMGPFERGVERLNAEIRRVFHEGVKKADADRDLAEQEASRELVAAKELLDWTNLIWIIYNEYMCCREDLVY